MSPAHVLEPTYDAIKRRLMVGEWPAGFRLEAARLAGDLGVSITPVRDSLSHLAGERLVDMIPGEGFRVPNPTEQDVRDLLDFNLLVLLGAFDGHGTATDTVVPAQSNHASETASLFRAIVRRSGNGEMLAAVQSLNARLHRFRLLETILLPGAEAEIAELYDARASADWNIVGRDLLSRYHFVRKRSAGDYIRMVTDRGADYSFS